MYCKSNQTEDTAFQCVFLFCNTKAVIFFHPHMPLYSIIFRVVRVSAYCKHSAFHFLFPLLELKMVLFKWFYSVHMQSDLGHVSRESWCLLWLLGTQHLEVLPLFTHFMLTVYWGHMGSGILECVKLFTIPRSPLHFCQYFFRTRKYFVWLCLNWYLNRLSVGES